MATSQDDSKENLALGEDEAYERAEREALRHLEQGIHLGGASGASRDELHER